MNWIELNKLLRNTIINIITLYDGDSGVQSAVFKSLTGNQGFSTISKWIDTSDPEKIYNLGLKPLTKIGNSVDYDVHVVFVPRNSEDSIKIKQYLESLNLSFIQQLKELIYNMVNQLNYRDIKFNQQYSVSKIIKKTLKNINYDI